MRKHTELCGFITLRQLAMKPRGKALFALLQQNIRQPLERIGADMERDRWMSPSEALDYGLIDKVIERRG